MDWKEIWKTVNSDNILRLLLVGAGTLIANYCRKRIRPFIKTVKEILRSEVDILALENADIEHAKKIKVLEDNISIYILEIGVLKVASKLHFKESFILRAKQMALVYCAPDPIFISNSQGEVTFVNPAWLNMTGMPTASDAYGYGYIKVVHPINKKSIQDDGELLIKHPSSYENVVIFQHFKTKKAIHTICRSEPIRDEEGNLVETIGRLSIINGELNT